MVLNMYGSLKYSWWLSGYIYNNLIAASQFLYIRDVDVDPTVQRCRSIKFLH